MALLVEELESFSDDENGLLAGISPEHGWGIQRRLDFAQEVRARSVEGDAALRRWEEALAAIADPARAPYGGLLIDPQPGLLPLGPDPTTGLWEFAHLQSGTPATRDDGGHLEFAQENGLVLVLLPAGSFLRGRRDGR